MNSIKNNFIKGLFAVLIVSAFTSCDKTGDSNPGGTSMQKYAGDWFIKGTDSDGNPSFAYSLHSTYNTAANDNTMWIDDHQNGYYIKCKVTVNIADGTFTATDSPNLYDGSLVTITEGKIEKNAATSLGGHTVDKISFTAHFDYDDPGYNIIYDGHKRTGFIEDEY